MFTVRNMILVSLELLLYTFEIEMYRRLISIVCMFELIPCLFKNTSFLFTLSLKIFKFEKLFIKPFVLSYYNGCWNLYVSFPFLNFSMGLIYNIACFCICFAPESI